MPRARTLAYALRRARARLAARDAQLRGAAVAGAVVIAGLNFILARTLVDASATALLALDAVLAATIAGAALLLIERTSAQQRGQGAADTATSDASDREFLYAIAHELRTPLTSIQAFADLLSERPVPEPQLVESLASGVERLGTLVDDLLELGRSEQRSERLELVALDVLAVLRRAEAILRPAFVERGQSLTMELLPPPVLARADAATLEQLLLNVLSNANRHTPRGGDVAVRVTQTGELVRIEVQDSGPGIAVEDRERIFEPFYRVQRPGVPPVPGSGLGLAIARRCAELQGGRIAVDDAPGGGSLFRIELAFAPATAGATAEPVGEGAVGVR